jgi:CRISPR-associated protein Cas2
MKNDGRAFYVIAYDIANNKRRAKIARAMEALGARVQGSVFEAWLTPAELKKLTGRAAKILNAEEDSLRYYMVCEACRDKIQTQGKARTTPPPSLMIV